MESFQRKCIICLFLGFACLFESGNANPDLTLVYKICNGETFAKDQAYYVERMVELVIQTVTNVADNGYDYYLCVHEEQTGFRGCAHAACSGKLSKADCNACAVSAHNLLISNCQRNVGAQIQLIDCRVRREIYDFNEG